jgi:outer membrane protein OmpA-like peptidoglycan-associated protein
VTERITRIPLRGPLMGLLLLAAAGCMKAPLDAPPRSVVFFDNFSTTVDGNGQGVITEVAKDALAHPERMVLVQGFADTVAAPNAYQTLSAQRAKAVADMLVAQGVPPGHIVTRPRGATQADPGIESRRVDVSFSN